MERFAQDRREPSAIPEDIAQAFDETDIQKVWDYLGKTFRLNKKVWQADFEKEFGNSTRKMTKTELFVRYGKRYFESSLNVILARNSQYPTWLLLIRYIVRDKIKKLEDERGRIAKQYGRNSGYKIYNRKY